MGSRYNKEIETAAVEWMMNNEYDIGSSLLYDVLGIQRTYQLHTAASAPVIKDRKSLAEALKR